MQLFLISIFNLKGRALFMEVRYIYMYTEQSLHNITISLKRTHSSCPELTQMLNILVTKIYYIYSCIIIERTQPFAKRIIRIHYSPLLPKRVYIRMECGIFMVRERRPLTPAALGFSNFMSRSPPLSAKRFRNRSEESRSETHSTLTARF